MARLRVVEEYVRSRRDKTNKGQPSIYGKFGHLLSFAVKYFDKSRECGKALSEIEHTASIERQEKCEELVDKQRIYHDLMEQYYDSACEFRDAIVIRSGLQVSVSRHYRRCQHCAFEKAAMALSITIHEWPVSLEVPIAKATIFELMAPETFSQWRDASVHLITDVLGFHSAQPQKVKDADIIYGLERHHMLSERLSAHHKTQRLIITSDIKARTGITRKKVNELKVKDVCLDNTLNYKYFDTVHRVWNNVLDQSGDLPTKLVYCMPKRSGTLDRFLLKPPSAPDGVPGNEPLVSVENLPNI